jgi:hypothetical protein
LQRFISGLKIRVSAVCVFRASCPAVPLEAVHSFRG